MSLHLTMSNEEDLDPIGQRPFGPTDTDRPICAKEFANIDKLPFESSVCRKKNIDKRISEEELIPRDDTLSDEYNRASGRNGEANTTHTSSTNAPQCVQIEPWEDCRLPDGIYKLLPGRSEKQIVDILTKVQDKCDQIWTDIDKKYATSSKNSSQIYGEFKGELQSYLSRTFTTQTKAIGDARLILLKQSFGIVFYNMKNEVLGVQNHNGTWSAVKGYRRIKNDGTFETPWETFLRELFEEVSIKLKRSKRDKTITKEDIGLLGINKTNFVQYRVDSNPGTNDRLRLIGLFYVHIDEKKFKFSLKDNKENKMCRWLNMNDILNNKPEIGRDIYYTLRPFVQHFKDHPIS